MPSAQQWLTSPMPYIRAIREYIRRTHGSKLSKREEHNLLGDIGYKAMQEALKRKINLRR